MSGDATDMVTIPRAELDALKAELRELRLAAGREAARAQILADPGPGDDAPVYTRDQLAQAWANPWLNDSSASPDSHGTRSKLSPNPNVWPSSE